MKVAKVMPMVTAVKSTAKKANKNFAAAMAVTAAPVQFRSAAKSAVKMPRIIAKAVSMFKH